MPRIKFSDRKDKLTSRERLSLALERKEVDRPPALPMIGGVSRRAIGISYDEWSTNWEAAAASFLAAQDLIGFDSLGASQDLSVEAADFGQEIVYPPESTAYPNFNNQYVGTVDDYKKLKRFDPRESKRMGGRIKIVSSLVKDRGDEVPVGGFVYGPLGVLSQIRGHRNLFADLIKHPDEVLEAVDLITDVLALDVKAQLEEGALGVTFDPLFSSASSLRAETWEKFEGPFLKRLTDIVHGAGAGVTIHNCGSGVYFDEVIKWSGAGAFSVANPAYGCKTWEEHAQKWGQKVITLGVSDPANTGHDFTYGEVLQDSWNQLDLFRKFDAGHVLATGCEFPPNGNLLNAIAMVEATRLYADRF
ncbi:MAG: uroporphyrinogen decarboxylase [Clostridiales Family XIII bacterium]|jgi:uroporphyrinogen decarboxylase|nr:uroporphyrinogen decarboxylase [Clostridiales Family XIII bacterium]